MADRATLRHILRTILTLSDKLGKDSLTEIRSLVGKVTTSVLEIRLPESKATSTVYDNIYAADIYQSHAISCSVFGMRKKNGRIPLHGNDC